MNRCLALASLLLVGWVVPGTAKTCRITYVTSSTAYVDAGRADGLAPGTTVEVVREGAVVATLRVTDVSERRAACAIETASVTLTAGDEARFTPQTAAPEPPSTPPPVAASEPDNESPQKSYLASLGLRGRIGVRFLGVFDQSGFGGDVTQPSADVRVDGSRVAGSAFDVHVDVRARRTNQVVASGAEYNDAEARVYRLNAIAYALSDRLRVTAGRQFSSALASVSTFDGVQVEYDRERFGGGVFAGTQPEPIDYGFSTDIQEYGVFLRARSAPRATVRWEGVAAGIGSYEDGDINREYVALLGRLMSHTVSLTLLQQIDVFRGWREEAEQQSTGWTSTFASARVHATERLDVDAGYDNRRDVRVYRDFVSPETAFDDSYRQGMWGGASFRFARRYRVGAVVRSSGGGPAGDAMSYTLTASASDFTAANLDVRLRSTRYDNERSDGWMASLSSGWSPGESWTVVGFAGLRSDRGKSIATPDVDSYWAGADLDVALRNGWYLDLSGEHNGAGEEAYDQVYTGLSWRF
ncbi:MAG TPA: hypothetical protein VFU38_07450 [Candidatus Krumholzibacteria bacterium]|nr:hypothetical protein [Candidatus Krumholzibacteria bacterium]